MTVIYTNDERKLADFSSTEKKTAIMRPEEFILLTEEGDFADTLNNF